MEAKTERKLSQGVLEAEEAVRACEAAKELERAGDYEGARSVLRPIWREFGERPPVEALPLYIKAEVLLRVGALTGWLGSTQQIPGAQGLAKDLITESLRAFQGIADHEKIAEAETDLGICYWREGAMDEARVWFHNALSHATAPDNKLRALVNSTLVEISSNRLDDALTLLNEAAPLVDSVDSHATLGRYHMQRALLYRRLGGAGNLDRALIENAAAAVHLKEANDKRQLARVENNIGFIFLQLKRYQEALDHFDRARKTLIDLRDFGTIAQVNESRARAFLAQGRYVEAEGTAAEAASLLDEGGEESLLAEALVSQGIAQARLGHFQVAFTTLKRAASIAETAGDPESAGRTLLTTILELREFLTADQIVQLYQEADSRLGNQLDAGATNLLRMCTRLVIVKGSETGGQDCPLNGSLAQAVVGYERQLIRNALNAAKGSVTRAAKTLGLRHQSLCYIINARHKELLTVRAPVRVRRKFSKKPEQPK